MSFQFSDPPKNKFRGYYLFITGGINGKISMNRILPSLFAFSILFSLDVAASGEFLCIGARPLSMGRSSVALSDLWSVGNNQAGVAFLKGSMAGISVETCFLPADVTITSMGACVATHPANFGVIIIRSGNSLYSEIKTGLSVSRKFGKYFSAGLQADYIRIQQSEGYPSVNLVSVEGGLMFRSEKNWTVAFHLANPVPQKISGNSPDRLPTIFRFGATCLVAEKLLLSGECEKDLVNPPVIHAGMEYDFLPWVCGRAGISTNPMTVAAGFGFNWRNWIVDIGSSYHFVLGYSPVVSLSYSFK